MKKLVYTLGALFICLSPLVVSAADFRVPENETQTMTLNSGDTSKNAYLIGKKVQIDGNVTRDMFATGEDIYVRGDVEDSVLAVGSTIDLTGKIGGTARVAGMNINITEKVSEDVFVVGDTVNITSTSEILGDLYVASSTLNISGKVSGTVFAIAGEIDIKGTVGGDLIVKRCKSLNLDSSAVITGKTKYSSETEATIDSGATHGAMEFTKVSSPTNNFRAIAGFGYWTGILSGLVFVLLIFLIFSKYIEDIIHKAYENTAANLGWGLLFVSALPVVALILAFTLLGTKFALLMGMVWATSLLFTTAISAIYAGTLVDKILRKEAAPRVNVYNAMYGFAVLTAVAAIPVIGGWAVALSFLISYGAISQWVMGKMKK